MAGARLVSVAQSALRRATVQPVVKELACAREERVLTI